ncbi:centromere protein S-like [Bacillus rossius redtenbacheri]|uniref:centromere protein S-like n=1 Tax=Bacillus rossius redtenbacheri TaxID=93214 RepID=UPI002FDED06C
MENLTTEQKLKATVIYDVRKVCSEALQGSGFTADRELKDLVAELVWKKLQIMAQDLELFAKHGKRLKVNADDVKLALRGLPSLKATITQMADEHVKKKQQQSNPAPETSKEIEKSEINKDVVTLD